MPCPLRDLSRHRKVEFYLNKKLPICFDINPWRQNPEALILACRWRYVIAKVKQFEIHQANKLHLNGHDGPFLFLLKREYLHSSTLSELLQVSPNHLTKTTIP